MRLITCVAVFFFCMMSCNKPGNDSGRVEVELQITKTTSPDIVLKGNDIVSRIKCQGPNLCYLFSHFNIKEVGERQFEIRAKGTFPKRQDIVCATAIYQVDTTARITAKTPGQYLLRFYNSNQLFNVDTVSVF